MKLGITIELEAGDIKACGEAVGDVIAAVPQKDAAWIPAIQNLAQMLLEYLRRREEIEAMERERLRAQRVTVTPANGDQRPPGPKAV